MTDFYIPQTLLFILGLKKLIDSGYFRQISIYLAPCALLTQQVQTFCRVAMLGHQMCVFWLSVTNNYKCCRNRIFGLISEHPVGSYLPR